MEFKKETIRHRHLIYLIFLTFVMFLGFDIVKNLNKFNFSYKQATENQKSLNAINDKNVLNFANSSSSEALKSIKAKSYLVYDLTRQKVLIGYNENQAYPLASISKLMTTYVADKNCADKLKLELDRVLVASDNNAADKIANNCPNYEDFVAMMNEEVKRNGLNMKFINPSGLDINNETEASNFGDAVSVARLIDLLYKIDKSRLSHTTFDNYQNIINTNHFADNLPFLVGSKTGFTDVAGGNLVTIYDILGNKIAIVVLGSTKEDRFSDTFLLLKSYLANVF